MTNLAIIIVSSLLILGYYVYTYIPMGNYLNIAESPQPMPTASPLYKINKAGDVISDFKDYSIAGNRVLDQNKKIVNVKFFKNPEIGMSFLYPDNTYLKSALYVYRHGPNDKYIIGVITDGPEAEKNYADELIECRTDPTPDGICSEGLPEWLDINAGELTQEIESENLVERINNRQVYSIKTQNIDGEYATTYEIRYQAGNKDYQLSVLSKTDYDKNQTYKFALWLLINSFTVTPN